MSGKRWHPAHRGTAIGGLSIVTVVPLSKKTRSNPSSSSTASCHSIHQGVFVLWSALPYRVAPASLCGGSRRKGRRRNPPRDRPITDDLVMIGMRCERNCTPPFTNPLAPSLPFQGQFEIAHSLTVTREVVFLLLFASEPAVRAPSSIRQTSVVFALPTGEGLAVEEWRGVAGNGGESKKSRAARQRSVSLGGCCS